MRATPPARRILIGCVLIGLLSATSCQRGSTPQAETAATPSPTAPRLTAPALDLLTRSGSFSRVDVLLSRAEAELTGRCMQASGFRYAPPPASANVGTDEDRIVNLADRRQHGYNLLNTRPGLARATASVGHPAGYDRVLDGVASDLTQIQLPDGEKIVVARAGCEAESRQRLYGDLPTWAAVSITPQRLNLRIGPRVAKDPTLAAAIRRWQACMSRHGYRYPSPDAARSQLAADYRRLGTTPRTRRREIDVAVADGNCATQLHIPSTVLALRRNHADGLGPAAKNRLLQVTRSWLAAANVARSIVHTG